MNRYITPKQPLRWEYLRDVIAVLVGRNFKLRYKRSALGVAWSMLVPIAQFAALYFVFNVIVPLGIPHFTTFLFSGYLPWAWLASSITAAAGSVTGNEDLVKQANFPVASLPAIAVMSESIQFLLSLPIVAFFMVGDGYQLSPPLAVLPILLAIQFVLILCISYLVAVLQVKFRDTQHIIGIVLFIAFYFTPIFWSDQRITEPYRTLVKFNPVATVLDGYRAILIDRKFPEFGPLAIVTIGSAAVLFFGYHLFRSQQDRFVEDM